MVEQEKIPFKPAIVGCERLPRDIENKLFSANLQGVWVHTDSEEIYRCLQLSGASSHVDTYELSGSIYYITRESIPFRKGDGSGMQMMDIDYPGDIYVSPRLREFYFNGIEKVGTVFAMIHGIRSFTNIQRGVLGLHSAAIYDKGAKQTHLLVGKNRVGKSTLGQALEKMSDRFVLVSDDWSEVDIPSDMAVTPVSPVFSPSEPTENYELVFVSFGKPYYRKCNIGTLPRSRVGKIIEIYGSEEELSSDDFLFRSLSHIPFLCQPLDGELFVCPYFRNSALVHEIQRRKGAIIDGYNHLRTNRPTRQLVNNPNKNTIMEATMGVLDILRH